MWGDLREAAVWKCLFQCYSVLGYKTPFDNLYQISNGQFLRSALMEEDRSGYTNCQGAKVKELA